MPASLLNSLASTLLSTAKLEAPFHGSWFQRAESKVCQERVLTHLHINYHFLPRQIPPFLCSLGCTWPLCSTTSWATPNPHHSAKGGTEEGGSSQNERTTGTIADLSPRSGRCAWKTKIHWEPRRGGSAGLATRGKPQVGKSNLKILKHSSRG